MTSKNATAMTLADAHLAPGHLIRRLQQISVAIFLEEFENWNVTSVQYIALIAIADQPGVEQKSLADLIAIDQSTVTHLVRLLQRRKLILRKTPEHDQRVKQLFITPEGQHLIDETRTLAERVQERIMAPIPLRERPGLISQLARIAHVNNEYSRAPLRLRSAR